MQITQLNVYPVKSARGLTLSETAISAEGLPGDRRAMLVDPSGQFITQRELPAIATLNVAPEAGGYRLSIEGKGDVLALPSSSRLDVTVWKSTVDAALASDEANRTLSQWLGQEMKLAFFDDQSKRLANAEWTGNETPVTFADGYQILVATTASLDALNADMTAHGEDSVGMERFRPNIVLETDDAWAEDRWAAIDINGIRFDLVKPCTRCIMTTQDQKTGSRDVPSPMKAMGRIRMSADRRVPGVLFGWNLTPRGEGTIKLGDVAKVVEWRDEAWPLKRRG
ncbi:MOSC domain-containing protein [Agrobacterium sp. SORGH_AS 787]|uniref:MOSC domain-containing protein n=1 Tax=Agrobacterium sp. SORGH_AS 787 TaxID=3041775 RepID=UPI00277F24DC|nr:uncharacterized protein YcbX [Rhizobium sp. SORGH_AS_0787]